MKIKNEALTEKELDTLADILDDISPEAMNLEMLDGFFCALICSPTLVQLNAYLPVIFGENYSFSSEKQATTFFELSMRHWNFIAGELLKSLEKDNPYLPIMLEDENGVQLGNDWATGFMKGIAFEPESWSETIDDDGGLLLPMLILAHENDPDIELRLTSHLPPDARKEVILNMVGSLILIYRFFAPYRASSTTTIRREGVKVGRNDSCPCGSNRKYKQCCGNNSQTIH